jgi:hypothetical protein
LKTVICHFYNEEWLLPWWLKHHKQIFDHGVMIDYASTDRGCDIIRELCPTWEIRPSRNTKFTPKEIDDEIMDIEAELTTNPPRGSWREYQPIGEQTWRITLNVTEFLYGNLDRLHTKKMNQTQYILPNYVFVDMEDASKCPPLTHEKPLHDQRWWGYFAPDHTKNPGPTGSPARLHRSIHNFPIRYPDWGRHYTFQDSDYTFDDLVIFYYGWADASEPAMKRKIQIQTRIPHRGGHHTGDQNIFLNQLRADHAVHSIDLRERISSIIEHNRRCTGQEF